jgi:hypothetical protein
MLQPNFFGVGINFNEIIERFSRKRKGIQLAIEHHDTGDKRPTTPKNESKWNGRGCVIDVARLEQHSCVSDNLTYRHNTTAAIS